MGAGTSKIGAHAAPTTRHELVFIRPAGVRKTLLTVRDATADATVDQENLHGDGSTAPITVIDGDGSVEWAFSLSQGEYDVAIAGVAQAAGLNIQGNNGLIFNIIRTSEVAGLTKSVRKLLNCKIGSDNESIDPAGNRRELSGMATNEDVNGVLRFQEAQ